VRTDLGTSGARWIGTVSEGCGRAAGDSRPTRTWSGPDRFIWSDDMLSRAARIALSVFVLMSAEVYQNDGSRARVQRGSERTHAISLELYEAGCERRA
jgi:hypothetical protein